MAQLEYGDYYKFTASAGIALIAGAVVVPWMFLREPFDLGCSITHVIMYQRLSFLCRSLTAFVDAGDLTGGFAIWLDTYADLASLGIHLKGIVAIPK